MNIKTGALVHKPKTPELSSGKNLKSHQKVAHTAQKHVHQEKPKGQKPGEKAMFQKKSNKMKVSKFL